MSKIIEGIINVNGRITPIHQATIPVFDHGFLYGDSIFETMRTVDHEKGHSPFQLSKHIDRLFHSARGLSLKIPFSKKYLTNEIFKTIRAYYKKYPPSELYVRLIVTRGYGDIGFDPKLCPKPSLVIILKKLKPLPRKFYEKGVEVALVPVIRNHPRALDPNIKSGNYLNNILAYMEAKKRGAFDAILLNDEGYLTESSNSNLFLIKGGQIQTPSLESGVLRGLTRAFIIEIARKHDLRVEETRIKEDGLFQSDECFLSSVLKRILPVTRCNGQPIGTGKVGPLSQKLMTLFDQEARCSHK